MSNSSTSYLFNTLYKINKIEENQYVKMNMYILLLYDHNNLP